MNIELFFDRDGKKWNLSDPEDLCDPLRCSWHCAMMKRKYKYPMKQLFMDRPLPINAHMTNLHKRFVWYRYHARIRHGVLTVGERRALCLCVDNEVELCFPPPFGKTRVGFRESTV